MWMDLAVLVTAITTLAIVIAVEFCIMRGYKPFKIKGRNKKVDCA